MGSRDRPFGLCLAASQVYLIPTFLGINISNSIKPPLFLLPFLEAFKPQVLCFGGQITGSASMFLPPVEEVCRERGIRLYVIGDTSLRTLQGLTCIAPLIRMSDNKVPDAPF